MRAVASAMNACRSVGEAKARLGTSTRFKRIDDEGNPYVVVTHRLDDRPAHELRANRAVCLHTVISQRHRNVTEHFVARRLQDALCESRARSRRCGDQAARQGHDQHERDTYRDHQPEEEVGREDVAEKDADRDRKGGRQTEHRARTLRRLRRAHPRKHRVRDVVACSIKGNNHARHNALPHFDCAHQWYGIGDASYEDGTEWLEGNPIKRTNFISCHF
jgi:hypothetical protein